MQSWTERGRQIRQAVEPQTLVEMIGTGRILVEHHKGIQSYGEQEILVGTSYGCLRITGEHLRLCCMSREQLFVAGSIHLVTPERCG